ncbi:hypothetical protein [Massilia sp. DWR3-1-1]|uniref:hypothetical protein n=1 Tax=Massilia sp. DWR3-1-1 TaxID=2804559 RepID=UPI003CF9264E
MANLDAVFGKEAAAAFFFAARCSGCDAHDRIASSLVPSLKLGIVVLTRQEQSGACNAISLAILDR